MIIFYIYSILLFGLYFNKRYLISIVKFLFAHVTKAIFMFGPKLRSDSHYQKNQNIGNGYHYYILQFAQFHGQVKTYRCKE